MLTYILTVTLSIPAIYAVTVCVYLFILSLGSIRYRLKTDPASPPLRIAVVVPAHNEEHGIEEIVSLARTLDYAPEDSGLFVIADNCTDETAHRAREAGATVFERQDAENRGKGQALDWCLKTQADSFSSYDVIAFVDADMHISMNFLRVLSESFSVTEVEIVQTMNMVSNPATNWRSALGFMSFAVINHVRPAGRCWLGGTAELRGSGMAFRRDLILAYGWPAHSIAEDAEFGKQLLLDGHRVAYNSRARVTSDIPVQKIQIETQQSRWEGGKSYLLKKYLPLYLKKFLKSPSVALLDALLDTLIPPLSLLIALLLPCALVSSFVSTPLMFIFLGCFTAVAWVIVVGLIQLRAPLKVWLYLGTVPVFVLWKLLLLLKVFKGGTQTEWERTPRDGELNEPEK